MFPNTAFKQSIIIDLIISERWAWVRHLVLVLTTAFLFGFFDNSLVEHAQKVGVSVKPFIIGEFIAFLSVLFFIYSNLYFLIPRFFIKGKFAPYILGLFAIGSLFFLETYICQKIYVDYFGKNADFALKFNLADYLEVLLSSIVIIASTTAFKLFKFWVNDQQRLASLEKQKVSAELDQLKNQVNPHFLFNTLNNLHVLSLTNPTKASDIILGLSDVLRYQIYDAKNEMVSLQKDIDILEQYLTIEKIRRDDLSFFIETQGNTSKVLVPPLLFVNFVENAIKYSNSRLKSEINLRFLVENKRVVFTCSNSKGATKPNKEDGGFGLKNVRKRLYLMYGNDFELEIDDQETMFYLKLNIPIP